MNEVTILIAKVFNIEYSFFNICLIYIIIKIINNILRRLNKPKQLSTNYKKITTAIVSTVSGVIFYYATDVKTETILCSAMLSIIAYDYFIKLIIDKFKPN